jgi:hypothetical protein
MKKGTRLRAALGAVTLAMLMVAMLAPVGPAAAGNGNGNGQGNGQGRGNGQGHGQGHVKDKDKDHGGTKHAGAPAPAGAAAKAKDRDKVKGRGGAEDEGTQAPTDAAAAGKSSKHAAIQACKKGGWRELQREDGTRFRNQGGCVSHAARGGVPAAVVPAVTILFAVSADLVSCDATATLVDFDPATMFVGTLIVDTLDAGAPSTTTDALGDASVPLGTFTPLQTLNLTVDGVSSGDVIVACFEEPIDPIAPID